MGHHSSKGNDISKGPQKSPLSVGNFQLGPPIAVDEEPHLSREAIAHVLGGSLKTTFPYPRNRGEGPAYCCMKSAENGLLPAQPGHHGLMVVKALPETLVPPLP